ncbi:Trm112 family protein [Nocardioides sp. SYSU DS0663]|uniref:Trm112 family protein n=1 Tax=Nocardioides sp. SYSU DS0663 TaxID=3416445 RepID=UPI003F4B7225
MNIDQGLLDIIVCPQCHGDLQPGEHAGVEELVCQGECGNAYPVRDDIPVLLVDEARKP